MSIPISHNVDSTLYIGLRIEEIFLSFSVRCYRAHLMNTSKGRNIIPARSQAERNKLAKVAVIADLREDPSVAPSDLAGKYGIPIATVYRIQSTLGLANRGEDRGEEWGRLLSRAVPLKLRARVMRDLVKSTNPVAAARALEMVLESDGLRKKVDAPSVRSVINVSANDDVSFT